MAKKKNDDLDELMDDPLGEPEDLFDTDEMSEELLDNAMNDNAPADIQPEEDVVSEAEKILQAVTLDQLDSMKKAELKSKFGQKECTVSDCDVKDRNRKLAEKIKMMQGRVYQTTRDNELLRRKQEELLKSKLTKQHLQEALVMLQKDEEVKQNNEIITNQQNKIKAYDHALKELANRFESYKNDVSNIKTKFEANKDIQERLKYIEQLKDNKDRLLMQNDDLDRENAKLKIANAKIVEGYNENLHRYKAMLDRLKDLEVISEKGFTLKLKSPRGVNLTPEKRRWKFWRKTS